MNQVILIGNVTKDPTITKTQNSTMARYTIAVARPKKDGERQADFISCKAYGKGAEFAERFLHKGTKIAVEGKIDAGSYEKDGQRIYYTDVLVFSHEFVEKKADAAAPTETDNDGWQDAEMDLPFN